MTLQQLRYFVAIAERGSISAAAHDLYTAQSNLSASISELERELGIEVFNRSNRGVTLTAEGIELIGYARQVLEQMNILESRYAGERRPRARLAVSTQHYAFAVRAFLDVVSACGEANYAFTLRETTTRQVIDDVASFRSDVGILYLSDFNERVISKALADASLTFSLLFTVPVHAFVRQGHPLSGRSSLSIEDLEPYPCYTFDQGTDNSFYFAEEPLSHLRHAKTVAISDRATCTSLLVGTDGFTLSTGVLVPEMQQGVVSVPLECDERMRVGTVAHASRTPDPLMIDYIERLGAVVSPLRAAFD